MAEYFCTFTPLPSRNWHLPSASSRMKSLTTAATDLQHILKGVQGQDKERGTRCSMKNWHNRPSGRCFQEKILWAKFLHLLISRKALKSLMVTPAHCDYTYPLFPNIILTPPTHTHFFGVYLTATETLTSKPQSSFCPKQNLTHNSHIMLFFSVDKTF